MTSLANVGLREANLTGAISAPEFSVETTAPPSGSFQGLVGQICYSSFERLESGPASWASMPFPSEPDATTHTYTGEEYQRTQQECLHLLTDWSGFIDLHNRLLPTAHELDPAQSRRVTEILFTKKFVRALD
jgi:hypothetical protein